MVTGFPNLSDVHFANQGRDIVVSRFGFLVTKIAIELLPWVVRDCSHGAILRIGDHLVAGILVTMARRVDPKVLRRSGPCMRGTVAFISIVVHPPLMGTTMVV